jgi:hypothetical protein
MNIVSTNKVHQFALTLKETKGQKFDDLASNQKSLLICQFGYTIWTFIGFFTFQWSAFLLLFFLGLIPKKQVWYRWIDSFISFILLLFIILNAYHFKVDIWEFICSF